MAVELGDVMFLSWRGRYAGQRIVLTHTLQNVIRPSNTRTPAQVMGSILQKVNPAIMGSVITNAYLAALPEQYTLEEIRAQLVFPTRYRWQSLNTAGFSGTNPNSANSGQLAGVLTFWTALSGRSQVANKHIGPLPDALSGNGVLTAGALATLLTLRATLAEPIDMITTLDGVWQPGIWHSRAKDGQPTFDQWISSTTQTTTRVMRRRTVGVGE